MKIVHVISRLNAADGGPPVVAMSLGAAQMALGNEVHWISHTEPAEVLEGPLVALPPFEQSTAWSTRIHSVPGLSRGIRKSLRTVRTVCRDATVVCLHGIWGPLLWLTARVCQVADVPYVVIPHGMLDPWSLTQSALKKKVALRFVCRRILAQAAFVHVLNDNEKASLLSLQAGARLEKIPNGVFLETFITPPLPRTFRAEFPALGDSPFILFLSRIHHKKGLTYLVEAMKLVASQRANVKLVIAGPDGGAEDEIRKQVEVADLGSQTLFVGPLYGQLKLAALHEASVFCLPSKQEGFSVAILEALCAKLPVVITDTCHFPEVKEYAAGRVISLDSSQIAGALCDVLDTHDARETFGGAGLQLVIQRYTWNVIAKHCVDLFATLRGNSGSASMAARLKGSDL